MKVEIRSDGTMHIEGYVNVAGRDSRMIHDKRGNFIEQITPGTFTKALQRGDDIGLYYNHQRALGAQSDGSITDLYEDQIGLYAKAVVSDSEVIAEARAGNLTGWSFAFNAIADRWENERRFVDELRLKEISILTKTPAYIATSIEARGEDVELIEYRTAEADEKVNITEEENAEGRNLEESKEADQEGVFLVEKKKKKLELLKLRYRNK